MTIVLLTLQIDFKTVYDKKTFCINDTNGIWEIGVKLFRIVIVKTKTYLVKRKKLATPDLGRYDYILVNYYIEQKLLQYIFRDNCSP